MVDHPIKHNIGVSLFLNRVELSSLFVRSRTFFLTSSLRCVLFTFGVKERDFIFDKNLTFYIKNKQALPSKKST